MAVTLMTPISARPSLLNDGEFAPEAEQLLEVELPRAVDEFNVNVPALNTLLEQAPAAIQAATDAQAAALTAINAPGTQATSATSLTIPTSLPASKSLTIQAGKSIVAGMSVTVASTASPSNRMGGAVTFYDGGTGSLTVNVTGVEGSGTFAAWTVSLGSGVGSATLGTNTFTGPQNEAKGANIASAASVNLDAATGNLVHITGTTTITAITLAAGAERTVMFDGALTITHNASTLVLPGLSNITTAAGDRAVFRGDGSGKTICIAYVRADGSDLIPKGIGSLAVMPRLVTGQTNAYTAPTGEIYMKTGVVAEKTSAAAAGYEVSILEAMGLCAPKANSGTSGNGQASNLAFGAGVFLRGNGNNVESSTDGVAWTTRYTGADNCTLVVFANNMFLAAGTSWMASSADGITNWIARSNPGSFIKNGLSFGNGTYVCTSNSSNSIYYSNDLASWNTGGGTYVCSQYSGRPAYYGGKFVFGGGSATDGIMVFDTTTRSLSRPYAHASGCYWAVAHNGSNRFVALSGSSTAVAAYSTDGGSTWSQATPNGQCFGGNQVTPLVYHSASGLFVGTNSNGGVQTSPDGATWTQRTMSTPSTPNTLGIANNVLFGLSGSADNQYINTSSDGITWTQRNLTASTYKHAVAYGAGVYVVVGASAASGSGNGVWSSADLSTWTQRLSGGTYQLYSVVYSATASMFVAVGANGIILSSPDGLTWTQRTSPTTQPLHRVNYANGYFVAVGGSGLAANQPVAYSTDGITWSSTATIVKSASYTVNVQCTCAEYQDSKWWLFGNQWACWTTGSTPTSWEVTYSGFVQSACGDVAFHNGMFFTSNNGNNSYDSVYRSTDGKKWIASYIANNSNYFTTTFMWMKVVNGKLFIPAYNSNSYLYSTDGVTWTSVTVSGPTTVGPIAHNGSVYFASGAATYYRNAISTDLSTWTPRQSLSSNALATLAYGNGIFLGYNSSYARVETTPDGITGSVGLTNSMSLTGTGDYDLYLKVAA